MHQFIVNQIAQVIQNKSQGTTNWYEIEPLEPFK